MEISKDFCDSLLNMIDIYLRNSETRELEAKCKWSLQKEDMNRYLQYLMSTDYVLESDNTILDVFFGEKYRASIVGSERITEFCYTREFTEKDKIIQKKPVVFEKKVVPRLEFSSHSKAHPFNIDLRDESTVSKKERLIALDIYSKDYNSKKYRLKKRYSFVPSKRKTLRIDVTIVKTSNDITMLKYQTSKEASFNRHYVDVSYEIEMEVQRNNRIAIMEDLIKTMVECYLVVANKSNQLVQKGQNIDVIKKYIDLVYNSNIIDANQLNNNPKKFFIGPQPVTLERINFHTLTQYEYTVTEKADGERTLLFVDDKGGCYFINNRLVVTTLNINLKSKMNCILDGELVNFDNSDKEYFLVFDMYWDDSTNIKTLPLVQKTKSDKLGKCRLQKAQMFCQKAKDMFLKKGIEIRVKDFFYDDNKDIFEHAKTILDKKSNGEYPYHIDGLIFTPKEDAVVDTPTWNKVLKWKPPSENTIDFLVKGPNLMTKETQKSSRGVFKVFDLYVGYNPSSWDPITSISFMNKSYVKKQGYIEKKFYPGDVNNNMFSTMTIPNEDNTIKADMIVECKYENDKWVPLRVREDKTELYRINKRIGGTANDYGTALSIWRSIQNPVTEEMIIGKEPIPDMIPGEDIYYFRQIARDKMMSKALLVYHNKFVKKDLIAKVKGKSLFDISCGKGGDLFKWINSGFEKVMGVDISRDNIENPNDGIFARFLQYTEKNKEQNTENLKYMFSVMDSSKKFNNENIVDPVNRFLWGLEKNKELPKQYYGFASSEFDVVSCQFSLHYFFKSEAILDNFVWNVNQQLKVGGCFIGTYLDSAKVTKKLKSVPKVEAKSGKEIIWSIEKKYDDANSKQIYDKNIDVFVESIGIKFTECLVSFTELKKKLAKYGIELEENTSFKDYYAENKEKIDEQMQKENLTFSKPEQSYSFMNNLFVFRKKDHKEK